ncbi:slr0065 [Synechocystis sp. PCC 6803]|uniref:Slr0065 protein n=1 Tax=Synechocystis sp. (strain ATCC 27184 / PCC 6803 / Kazusa) TaxID=1111708 RepID=Q55157_SYNY3|nr:MULTISPECIES: class I SAM-dependent methyltransferase [unclassified Synechocystis]BAM54356.1 hypothetical protein BEST7613_5425 [Synechocystis sp. PCC 6803] [Bacillus subtilis BEST7613]AGF52586.1 hypothetical protein MYO_123550 [Synechocystis sp. PCC 6803]ALJ68510.1 SAM-dependent methyltransferase [Synechocystis sp. PCC 6803]AVP90355.1 DUF938 domain-containing protein [Synechocystis sp. IPPAS B-1465]MBD2616909.1 DUF938 domain-containing protein [Synechocystis sp. FACHB-898]
MTDRRQYAPATQRNRETIAAVLQEYLPSQGSILEIASGTGEHACFFAPLFSPRWWITSDPDPLCRESIMAWRDHQALANFQSPLDLDVNDQVWPVEREILREPVTSIVAINLIHISPWESCLGLLTGAERILPEGGILYLYGPYRQKGVPTAPSNEAFDQSLQSRNPAWGLRQLEDVIGEAGKRNLHNQAIIPMPANNLSVIFQKGSGQNSG